MGSIQTKIDVVVEVLIDAFSKDKTISFPAKGTSMLPLIHSDDLVTLSKVNRPLKKGDIVFYKRDNGQYVLHRIRRIKGDTLDIVGDHQRVVEKGVRKDTVIGILISYKKKKNDKEYHLNGFRYGIYKVFIKSSIIRYINGKVFRK